MRILLSCLQDLRLHTIPAYRFWVNYFRSGIAEAGHACAEVQNVDWAEGISDLEPAQLRRWRDTSWSRTLLWLAEEAKRGRPVDLFLSYLYPEQIEPAALSEIRRRGIPTVNFFCDNVRQFSRIPAAYYGFDLHWVPEFEAIPMYKSVGLKHVHVPMPVWIPPSLRSLPEREAGGPLFIGSHDGMRQNLLGSAIAKGAAISIKGHGWLAGKPASAALPGSNTVFRRRSRFQNQIRFLRTQGASQWINKLRGNSLPSMSVAIPESAMALPVSMEDYARLTRESEITLGINRVPTFRASWREPKKYSRLRDIEAPMMGACYLTEWTAGLDQLYQLGTEIETYRTAEELTEKIRELQADPAKRKRLRQLGQKRALNDLNMTKSLQKIALSLQMTNGRAVSQRT